MSAAATDDDIEATLAAWRAADAGGTQPWRLAFLEAMARRRLAHTGAARQHLDARLAAAMAAFAALPAVAAAASDASRMPAASPGPLAGLIAALNAGSAAPPGASGPPAEAGAADGPPPVLHGQARPGHASQVPEPAATAPVALKSATRHRRTWQRLATEQRLQRSHAQVPANAGPLHSQALMQRALTQMRALSPDYLGHFMAHVDALLALQQALHDPLLPPLKAAGAKAASVAGPANAGATAAPTPPRRSRAKR